MAKSNTAQPATKPAAKKQPAEKKQPAASRPANVVTVQDLAEQLSTTPKALRARIRASKTVDRVGKGGKYGFTPAQAKALVSQLTKKS